MKIEKIQVSNFRLLKDCSVTLDPVSTLIVGRNNSGKTSLTELFRRLFSDKGPTFLLEDFSLSAHKGFWKAYELFDADGDEDEVRNLLPVIEVKMTVVYPQEATELGPLGKFIVDLDPATTTTNIVVRYDLASGKIKDFFNGILEKIGEETTEPNADFFKLIKEKISKHYKTRVFAEDPNDATNIREMEWSQLQSVLKLGCVSAQRGLNDETVKESDLLGKILVSLFATAVSDTANDHDREIAEDLQEAVLDTQTKLDADFKTKLSELVPALSEFGYPGFRDPGLTTETTFDVERLLSNHTKVRYQGANGVNLPESFNGLGARNLIFILLKLLEFFKEYQSNQAVPSMHVIFIEEPEAHLHPQMQEVFIRKLSDIAKSFADRFNNGTPWPVQFIVTTHSSHIANEAPFSSTRYFVALPEEIEGTTYHSTTIKDLGTGLKDCDPEWISFLHQYMTLTRCDLLFADKAILIEGTSERLLLPEMIKKMEVGLPEDAQKLSSQYMSVMEVGGAYAHKFNPLLDFLELRSLIITDLDSVRNDNGSNKACKVSEGEATSNACIRDWFNDPTLTVEQILQKTDAEKTQDLRRIAYQVTTEGASVCGRSFEGDFMLNNQVKFGIDTLDDPTKEQRVYDEATKVKKTEFALQYAIDDKEWSVPKYINDGLLWLKEGPATPEVVIPAVAKKTTKKTAKK